MKSWLDFLVFGFIAEEKYFIAKSSGDFIIDMKISKLFLACGIFMR